MREFAPRGKPRLVVGEALVVDSTTSRLFRAVRRAQCALQLERALGDAQRGLLVALRTFVTGDAGAECALWVG